MKVRSRCTRCGLRENTYLVERASIAGSLKNLMTYPWVRERVEAGTLVPARPGRARHRDPGHRGRQHAADAAL